MTAAARKGFDYPGICVVFFCHDGEGNFVMGKRSKNARDEHGRWVCGGGGVKFGTTIDENIRREIKEEYGTDVISYEFMGYLDTHGEHNGEKTHWLELDFKVLVDKNKVHNAEPEMFDEVKWFTLDTLPTPLHSQLPTFFKKFRDKLESRK